MERDVSTKRHDAHQLAVDANRKFVRVAEVRKDGFVAFDFAIGEPEYFAELLLPSEAFADFCRENRVIELAPHDGADTANEFDWSLRQAIEAAATGRNPAITPKTGEYN